MTDKDFEKIVAETKRAVLGAIRSTLHPELQAYIDDVAQETFIRMYQHIQKKGMDSLNKNTLTSYAYVIARNESIRMNEKKGRHEKLTEKLKQHTITVTNEDNSPIGIDLTGLKEPFNKTLQLFIQGYSQSEIAVTLNIKPGTVRSRLNRAKTELQKLMYAQKRGR